VIFRNTPQWFIRLDQPIEIDCHPGRSEAESRDPPGPYTREVPDRASGASGMTLRERALAAIDETTFHPAGGRNRIRGMVETRPDWLVSRQRAWGTPLAMFVDRATGEPLVDPEVEARIVEAIRTGGADAWFERPDADFLGDLDPSAYEKVVDILDVWFDSGCTHAFTLEGRENTRWPADLYSEGSDQHRGWFQSSLLEASGTRGRAPYKAIMTHGFTLDEAGEKQSKSQGNTTAPQTIIKESGAEILRLWTAMVDVAEDQRIGKTILQTTADAYRKLRNTVRYLLGALRDFDDAERVDYAEMPPLERFILHRLYELDGLVRAAYAEYRFADVLRPLAEFCGGDLSALYFDIRKDSLYCDRPDALRRRACRTVMDLVFERLTAWLAPLIPFTMEEAWSTRFPNAGFNSARVIPDTPAEWRNDEEAGRWSQIEVVLTVVNAALEAERREKRIGSALDAAPVISVRIPSLLNAFENLDGAEIFRTSGASLRADALEGDAFTLPGIPGVAVAPNLADGEKCARSWKVLPEVARNLQQHGMPLTDRDLDAVQWWDAQHGR
jgi:isoleucyl-tRNA synthetase